MNLTGFMETLFETKPDDPFILIWQAKNKRSTWFQEIGEAITFIERNPEDIYYGVGASPKNFGKAKRCKATSIAGIPGLYADIDIGDKSGKKYPPTFQDAVDLISVNGMQPTLIVHSGNGLHAYWLFKEFWNFDSKQEREQAADLNLRLHLKLKERAMKKGWHIDSVFDLSRVLRPPGTKNCKSDPPKPVTVFKDDGPRYTDGDVFEELLPTAGHYDISHSRITPSDLKEVEKVLRLKNIAEPPQSALDMLLEADVVFKAAWQQIKDDRKDTSTSGYHWDLTVHAVRAGWKDQEIANLLIAWNRRHGHPLNKVLRVDYIARTIGKARQKVSKELADEFSEEVKEIDKTVAAGPMKDSLKKKCLDIISHHCGFEILEIIKFIQEERMKYKMVTANKGNIHFQGQDELLSRAKFVQRIFAHTNIAPIISTKDWGSIVNTYKHIIRDVVVSSENTVESRIETWVVEYLEGQRQRNQHEGAVDDFPFVHKGHWHIFPTKFKEWAYRVKHDRGTVAKTKTDLKLIGAAEKRFNPKHPLDETKRIKKLAWRIPHSVAMP